MKIRVCPRYFIRECKSSYNNYTSYTTYITFTTYAYTNASINLNKQI